MASQEKKGRVTLRGRFVDGQEVGVFPRVGDFFDLAGLGSPVKKEKPRNGETHFEGLIAGADYWAVQWVRGESAPRQVRFRAHSDDPAGDAHVAHEVTEARVAQLSPPPHPGGGVVTGARNSRSRRAVSEAHAETVIAASAIPGMHEPNKAKQRELEPHPRVKQAEVKGPQRSDTPMGEGHPVDKREIQPKIPQSELGRGALQRSDTELGEATPVLRDEVQPAVRQEDVGRGVKQRSATETGQAEPLPTVGATESAKYRSSSENKAKGGSKGQAAQKKPKASRKAAKRAKDQARPARKSSGRKSGSSSPKRAESKPAQQPKRAEAPRPAQAPKPVQEPKEEPKPSQAPRPAAPRPASTTPRPVSYPPRLGRDSSSDDKEKN